MEDGRLLDRLSGLGFASAVAISHDDRYLAIEDFRAYVEALAEVPSMAASVKLRKTWIEDLRAGRDPFDDASIRKLWSE